VVVALAADVRTVDEHLAAVNLQQDTVTPPTSNDTIQVAFDPLEPVQIVSNNMEVYSRIYQSCVGGDQNARWTDRSNAKSAPNGHCYMVFLSERTWFQARRLCEEPPIPNHVMLSA